MVVGQKLVSRVNMAHSDYKIERGKEYTISEVNGVYVIVDGFFLTFSTIENDSFNIWNYFYKLSEVRKMKLYSIKQSINSTYRFSELDI